MNVRGRQEPVVHSWPWHKPWEAEVLFDNIARKKSKAAKQLNLTGILPKCPIKLC